ncbi:MAG: hypothetical protein ACOX7X_07920 [Methanosarcina flavescens]|jgi:hypothetical protein|uniref:Uncharacterized protein n=1 Tax=Methanosarcina flavescens TaxID=1715806 RepID=A0A660HNX6_9EURY|nr:hypothetical protein AOB57_001020 [Methanosarcina flavescens]
MIFLTVLLSHDFIKLRLPATWVSLFGLFVLSGIWQSPETVLIKNLPELLFPEVTITFTGSIL